MSSYNGTVEDVEKARAKRRKEIQAWALADQAAADALLGVPTTIGNDWDLLEPETQEAVSEQFVSTPVVQEIESVSVPAVQEEEHETEIVETVEPPKAAPKTPKSRAIAPK